MSALFRFSGAMLLLAGLLATASVRAEDTVPAATALEVAPVPMEPAAPVQAAPAAEQPSTAFPAAPAKTAKKKAHRRSSQDFAKKHVKKKKKLARKFSATKPAAPPLPKTYYDPASAEPSEEVMAIKRRAERQFWDGKQPLPNAASTRSGIASTALTAPNPNNMERAGSSDLAGVTFDDQPLRMPELEPFRRSIDTVAFELGRPCHGREYLGWPLQQTEQDRVDHIFNDTVEKLRQRGFTIAPHQPKAAGTDISVFTADRVESTNSRYILGLWSAGDVGLLLLMCETGTPPDLVAAEAKSKEALAKKSKKKRPRKKSKAKTEAAAPVTAEEKPAEAAPAAVAPPPPAPTPEQLAPAAPVPDQGKPKVMPGVSPEAAMAPAPTAAAPMVPVAPSSPATIEPAPAAASAPAPASSSANAPVLPPPEGAPASAPQPAPEPESNAMPSAVQTMSYDEPAPKPAEAPPAEKQPAAKVPAPAKIAPGSRSFSGAPPPPDAPAADTTNTMPSQ